MQSTSLLIFIDVTSLEIHLAFHHIFIFVWHRTTTGSQFSTFITKNQVQFIFKKRGERGSGLRDAWKTNLSTSILHHVKFISLKDEIIEWIQTSGNRLPLLVLNATRKNGGRFYAYILNDEYAFRHIFKTGGTTVELQTHAGHMGQVSGEVVGERKLVAVVRDPVSHFLSGWAECGARNPSEMMKDDDLGRDNRILEWLWILSSDFEQCYRYFSKSLCGCRVHSYPQSHFLLAKNDTFNFDAKLNLLGDLGELQKVLEVTRFFIWLFNRKWTKRIRK